MLLAGFLELTSSHSTSPLGIVEMHTAEYDENVKPRQIVLDTNVLLSGLKSRKGASFRVLQLLDSGRFEINLSVPLVLEYEDVCRRPLRGVPFEDEDVDDTIDYLCQIGNRREIYYLWRPSLTDPGDEMILDLAVASAADIVTFNIADFDGAAQFGIRALTPGQFLREIGAQP